MNAKVGPDRRLNYYLEPVSTVVTELRSHREGLTNPEAARRLDSNGYNSLASLPSATPVKAFAHHSFSWQTASLLVAAALSWHAVGEAAGLTITLFTLAVITINTWREQNHTSLTYNLDKLIPNKAAVMRSSVEKVIDANELVVGDVITLNHGSVVPADVRIMYERHFTTDDYALTGSHEVQHKYAHPLEHEVPVTQRHNLALAGTTVISGKARGIVIATGVHTELGRITSLTYSTPPQWSAAHHALLTHSQRWFIGLVAATTAITAANWSEWLPVSISETLLAVIAIAASLGGFSVISTWLFMRLRKQAARHGGIISRVSAATSLAGIDTLLLDEDGFLLGSQPSVQELHIGKQSYTVTGGSYEPKGEIVRSTGRKVGQKTLGDYQLFFEAAAFTSRASLLPPDAEHEDWHAAGPHQDGVLLALAHKAGIDSTELYTRSPEQIHYKYDHARQMTSTVHRYDHRTMVFTRGEATAVLERCTRIWDGGHTRQLSKTERTRLSEYYQTHADKGRHVIVLAYRTMPAQSAARISMQEAEHGLTLLGSAAIDYPMERDTGKQLAMLAHGEVQVSLVSSRSIAHVSSCIAQTGLRIDTFVTGKHLQQMADGQIVELLAKGTAFTHLSPEDHLRIVDVARNNRLRVAVTGNGLQHVPALRHAHVGIADTRAVVAVTDEAGLNLHDNDLGALTASIDASRTFIRNLRTAGMVSLADGVALVTLAAIGIGLYSLWRAPSSITPMLALCILLAAPLSLVGISNPKARQRTLAARTDVLRSISETWTGYAGKGLLMAMFAVLASLAYFMQQRLSPTYLPATGSFAMHAATLTFVSLVVMQTCNVWLDRTPVHRVTDKHLLRWMIAPLVFVLLVVYLPPMQRLVHSQPLTVIDWLVAIVAAAGYFAMRWAIRHEHKHHSRHAIIQLHHEVHGHDSGAKI